MVGILHHRGPDESGIYLDPWVGLGHARLSIIDLSTGSQPIHNEDETIWIVYNGEIFNYKELRAYLTGKGHQFYTTSDTEVIIHIYEEEGPSCVNRLNGQFAFAIWDAEKRDLFLARDRVGIHPLHYTIQDNVLYFASEIKSLLIVDEIPREIDRTTLDQIFTFWAPLPGRTIFKDIHELPPGHTLTASHGKLTIQKYWDLPFCSPDEYIDYPGQELCERVQELLIDSIRIRLQADVPVGSYLSGGLDSSGVTAIVKNRFNSQVKTFGIRFDEAAFDEGHYQMEMVAYLKTNHTSVHATNPEIAAVLPDVIWHCEKPILRTAPAPLYLLSKIVHEENIKVVVTGEGADEVFGGYDIFREMKVRRFMAKNPNAKFRSCLVRRLYPDIFKDPRSAALLDAFFGQGLDQALDPFFSHLIRWRNTSRIKAFFSRDIQAVSERSDSLEELKSLLPGSFSSWDPLSKAQYLEMSLFMSNYLLSSQGDRVAMANSLEVRPPFLDHRILDFMGRVRPTWKISGLDVKYILKKALEPFLPQTTIERIKQPFRAPIGRYLLEGRVPYFNDLLSESMIKRFNLFDSQTVDKLVRKAKRAPRLSEFNSMALTGILSTQVVFDRFIYQFPRKDKYTTHPKILIRKT